jgi:hypothetical protein
MRITNQANAGSAIPQIIDSGWQLPVSNAPLESPGNGFDSSPNGTTSSTWTATSTFGRLTFSGNANASNSPGFGVACACDEPTPAAPKAWFRDRITAVSTTLAAGAPVTVRATLTLTGAASSSDPTADRSFGALFRDDGGALVNLNLVNAPGTVAQSFILPVGVNAQFNAQLFCILRLQRVSGTTAFSDTMQADLEAAVTLEVLTPGATLQACSGTVYASNCAADIAGTGGTQGPDGTLDNNDFVVFVDDFFNHEAEADRGTTGGVPGHDGVFDNNDFVVFIDQFFQGCS